MEQASMEIYWNAADGSGYAFLEQQVLDVARDALAELPEPEREPG